MGDTIVIFHGGCTDGFTAAWAARRAMPEARLMGAGHGDPPPSDLAADDEVILVDFAYPREMHLALAETVADIRVLDHHRTAADDIGDLPGTLFDMDRSGAGIAWDELVGDPRPWLIDYVEARDLWRLDAFPHLAEVCAYIDTQPHDLAVWDELSSRPVEEVAELGRGARALAEANAKRSIRRAQLVELATDPPTQLPMVNLATGVSDACHALLDASGAEVVGYWYQGASGRHHYGLRSRPDIDSSPIARHFGGGGHPQANGFRTHEPVHRFVRPLKGD